MFKIFLIRKTDDYIMM